jgi:hypothetical protein
MCEYRRKAGSPVKTRHRHVMSFILTDEVMVVAVVVVVVAAAAAVVVLKQRF